MKTVCTTVLNAAVMLSCAAAFAEDTKPAPMRKEQDAMMQAMQRMGEIRPEHKQLAYFIGDWKTTTTMWMDPKAAPQTSEGKSHGAALYEGRYIETHHEGT